MGKSLFLLRAGNGNEKTNMEKFNKIDFCYFGGHVDNCKTLFPNTLYRIYDIWVGLREDVPGSG